MSDQNKTKEQLIDALKATRRQIAELEASQAKQQRTEQTLRLSLVAIHQLGRELNLLRDETTIVKRVLTAAAGLLQFRGAGYGLVDQAANELVYHYYPNHASSETVTFRLPLNGSGRGAVTTPDSGGENLSLCLHKTPFFPPNRSNHRWLSTPMKIRERVIGVLDVVNLEPHNFSSGDRQLLQTLADLTAVALENARLYDEARQRVEELAALSMISQAITSTLDLQATLSTVTDHAIRLLDVSAASVILRDPAQGDLCFQAVSGPVADCVREFRLASGQGIAGWVVEHGESTVVADVSQDPRFFDGIDQRSGFTTHSILCVPLQTRKRIIGAIQVMNKRRGKFDQRDMRLLNWLAIPTINAVENARLFEAERAAREQIRLGQERLRSLSRRLVEIQETERCHIARELHDEASQALTSLMVGLHLLEQDARCPNEVAIQVASLKKTANGVLENLHRLARDLRPVSLDHVGLLAALHQYIEQFGQQYGLVTQFEATGLEDKRLPPEVEINLYRIVQEALTNVARHAQARRADVLLEHRHNRLLLIIEDDGIGFELEAAWQNGRLGLLGLRERAEMLGGNLTVESSVGTGTTIVVEAPDVYSHPHC